MHIVNEQPRQAHIQWAEQVGKLLRQHGDTTAAAEIDEAVEQYRQERFVLSVLGKAKRGKSTLINAMLGRADDAIAPVDKLPASSAITRITWAAEEAALVTYQDRRSEPIPFHRIREFVTEEGNPENSKQVDAVEVQGPFPGLGPDTVLVDTPGAASIHEHHDALLQAFIPQSDAVLFLVSARMPLDQDELELLRHVKEADIRKVFFAINRVDESNDRDIDDAISHNQSLLAQVGVHVEEIHRISAKRAFDGDAAGGGVGELLDEIGEFLAQNKGRVLDSRLIARVGQAAQPAASALDVEVASASRSDEQLEEEIHRLDDTRNTLAKDRERIEREFSLAWDRAVDDLERELPSLKRTGRAAIANQISSASLLKVSALAKQLPGQITDQIEQTLAPRVQQMEAGLKEATERLQARYPVLDLSETGQVTVRTPQDNRLVATSLGGAAAAATGVGLASAGASAAASIAATNAAMTATVTAPSLIASAAPWLTSWLPSAVAGPVTSAVTTLGTGTVTVQAGYVTTPLWVALAGPVGWSLAGIGVLAVPLAWRSSKLKAKNQLEQASCEQVEQVFESIRNERLPALHALGKSLVEEFRLRLDRQLDEIEASMKRARDNRPSPKQLAELQQQHQALSAALAQGPSSSLE